MTRSTAPEWNLRKTTLANWKLHNLPHHEELHKILKKSYQKKQTKFKLSSLSINRTSTQSLFYPQVCWIRSLRAIFYLALRVMIWVTLWTFLNQSIVQLIMTSVIWTTIFCRPWLRIHEINLLRGFKNGNQFSIKVKLKFLISKQMKIHFNCLLSM